jgi:VanZ like family.
MIKTMTYFIPTFLVFAVPGFFLWKPLVRKFSWRPKTTLVFLLYFAVVLGLTLSPSGGYSIAYQTGLSLPEISDITHMINSFEGPLNILLFIPFGLLSVLATRKYWQSLLAGFLASIIIELLQGIPFISRASVTQDVISNLVGTIIGVLIAWLVNSLISRKKDAKQTDISEK